MKVYASRSAQFSISVYVDGKRIDVPFDFTVPADLIKCAYVRDEKVQQALESTSVYGSEFWLISEVKEKQPEVFVEPEVTEVKEEPKQVQDGLTVHPEIDTVQKAKLLLRQLFEDIPFSRLSNAEKVLFEAKAHNISFPNLKAHE